MTDDMARWQAERTPEELEVMREGAALGAKRGSLESDIRTLATMAGFERSARAAYLSARRVHRQYRRLVLTAVSEWNDEAAWRGYATIPAPELSGD